MVGLTGKMEWDRVGWNSDGSEIRQTHQLRLVVYYPIIHRAYNVYKSQVVV